MAPLPTVVLVTPVVVLIYLLFAYVIRRGPFPTLEPAPLKHVYLEVILLFTPAFLSNAWRVYLFSQGSPEPYTTYASYALLVSEAIPLVSQLLVRRRPISELGFTMIKSWRATLILIVWLAIFALGSIFGRLYLGTLSFPLLSKAAVIAVGLFFEELLFRGFILTRLETLHGVRQGWLYAAPWWGLIHIWQGFQVGWLAAIFGVIQITALGLLWGVAFAKSRSLLTTWPIHVIYDLFVAITPR